MATKTFPYSVIWNGEIIPANTPIEVEEEQATVEEEEQATVEEKKTEKPKKKAVKSDDNA